MKVFNSVWLVWCLFANNLNAENVRNSRITLISGSYENILIAIKDDVNELDCKNILGNILESFIVASQKLETATYGKANFGEINVLIPRTWKNTSCFSNPDKNRSFLPAAHSHSYSIADIKITSSHPIAKSLPWTKQYKECGQQSETIFIPPEFLKTVDFDLTTKGQIILHEWAKFRYGVFEEFGFFNDKMFSPCYTEDGKQHFTSYTMPALDPIHDGLTISNEECWNVIASKEEQIRKQISSRNSSIMSGPHLENVTYFCLNQTYNISNTKQNVLCNGRSVCDVVFSHSDFVKTDNSRNFLSHVRSTPTLKVIQHATKYTNGYAFLIEDCIGTYQFSALHHIKQSVAQMIQFASSSDSVILIKYCKTIDSIISEPLLLITVQDKVHFLNQFPDYDTPGLPEEHSDLANAFLTTLDVLMKYENYKWDIILVATQSPSTFSLDFIMGSVAHTDHQLSVISFDSSSEWMKLNEISQTRTFIFLPNYCTKDCSTQPSSLITDYFLEILCTTQPRKFIHKVEIKIENDFGSFRLDTPEVEVTTFLFAFPTFRTDFNLTLNSPSGAECNGQPLLDYIGVFTIDAETRDCGYQEGVWTVFISGVERNLTDHAYIYLQNNRSDLLISTSFGRSLPNVFLPPYDLLPVYVSVSDQDNIPIINAAVEMTLYIFDSNSYDNIQQIIFHDDGSNPDMIEDDGVYSAYGLNYTSLQSSYSLGQIKVSTNKKNVTSLRMESIIKNSTEGAALLDTRMNTKCCGSHVPVKHSRLMETAVVYSVVLPSYKIGRSGIKSVSQMTLLNEEATVNAVESSSTELSTESTETESFSKLSTESELSTISTEYESSTISSTETESSEKSSTETESYIQSTARTPTTLLESSTITEVTSPYETSTEGCNCNTNSSGNGFVVLLVFTIIFLIIIVFLSLTIFLIKRNTPDIQILEILKSSFGISKPNNTVVSNNPEGGAAQQSNTKNERSKFQCSLSCCKLSNIRKIFRKDKSDHLDNSLNNIPGRGTPPSREELRGEPHPTQPQRNPIEIAPPPSTSIRIMNPNDYSPSVRNNSLSSTISQQFSDEDFNSIKNSDTESEYNYEAEA